MYCLSKADTVREEPAPNNEGWVGLVLFYMNQGIGNAHIVVTLLSREWASKINN